MTLNVLADRFLYHVVCLPAQQLSEPMCHLSRDIKKTNQTGRSGPLNGLQQDVYIRAIE